MVLTKYLNEIKDEYFSDEILNKKIDGCVYELIKLSIRKCNDQVKDKLTQ
jgi:hypothetical protein